MVLAQKQAEKFKSDLAICQQESDQKSNEAKILKGDIYELEQSNVKLKNETEKSRKEIDFLKNELQKLEQTITNFKNESLLGQNETENSNNRTNSIENLEQINLNLRNETEKCEQEVQKLQQQIASSINRTSEGSESERQSNETEIVMHDIEKLPIMTSENSIETSDSAMTPDIETFNNDVSLCQQEATKLKTDLERCQEQAANRCSADRLREGSLQSTGNVVISLIRQVENAREIDACLGMTSEFGYFTFHQCCQADQVTLFDLETYEEIPIRTNSLWIEEHVCFINTTKIGMINFSSFDNDEVQTCTTMTYEESEGEFTQYQLDIQIGSCFDSPCSLNIVPIQNGRIFNGTSVVCEPSGQIGIITKSKLYFHLFDNNQFQGLNNEEIELIMLSESRLNNLELLQKANNVNATDQNYEDVDGFESLRNICTIICESRIEKT